MAKKYTTEEHVLQRQTESLAMMLGWLVIRVNSGAYSDGKRYLRFYVIANTGESAGLSDLIVFKNGTAIFLEIKRPKQKQTPAQKRFEALATGYNMEYYVVDNITDAGTILCKQREES